MFLDNSALNGKDKTIFRAAAVDIIKTDILKFYASLPSKYTSVRERLTRSSMIDNIWPVVKYSSFAISKYFAFKIGVAMRHRQRAEAAQKCFISHGNYNKRPALWK